MLPLLHDRASCGDTGHNTTDTETYNIKFTFLASPLSSSSSNASAPQYQPTGSVERIAGGSLTDGNSPDGPARAAFSDLVARLYFNVLTATLGNACNPGCALCA